MNKIITKDDFIKKVYELLNVKSIQSKTGEATYSRFQITKGVISFIRDKTDKPWEIDIDGLYDAYKSLDIITNLKQLKSYVNYKTYSPSFAILLFIGLYNREGKRHHDIKRVYAEQQF